MTSRPRETSYRLPPKSLIKTRDHKHRCPATADGVQDKIRTEMPSRLGRVMKKEKKIFLQWCHLPIGKKGSREVKFGMNDILSLPRL